MLPALTLFTSDVPSAEHWPLWFLGSACALALYDLLKKTSVRDNAVLPTLLISSFFGMLAFVASVAIVDELPEVLHPSARALAFAGIKAIIVAVSWIFTFCAVRVMPVTVATPIRSSTPALIFILAFFIYGYSRFLILFLIS